jgi:protein PsiE
MKKIYKLAANFSHILRLCTIGALAILGILLTIILFTETFSLIPLMQDGNTDHVIFKILDRVIVFFLFFSFMTMIIAALKHHGRIAGRLSIKLRNYGFNPGTNCRPRSAL